MRETADAAPPSAVLPRELMELQLGQVELLMAMYPSEDEVLLEEGSRELLGALKAWCDGGGGGGGGDGGSSDGGSSTRDTAQPAAHVPPDLSFVLSLEVAGGQQQQQQQQHPASTMTTAMPRRLLLQLDVALPLRYEGRGPPPAQPPGPRVRIRQPDWLSRAETARLAAEALPDTVDDDDDDDGGGGDLLAVVERVRDAGAACSSRSRDDGGAPGEGQGGRGRGRGGGGDGGDDDLSHHHHRRPEDTAPPPLVRVWFYFPSISTRSKRDDLVAHAPRHGLTGFLLAGKPGVLCLEGAAGDVDGFMRFVRTESWGDIPAHHKKVSERYREELGTGAGAGAGAGIARAFPDMREITDALGPGSGRRGERANRTDMRALEAWLVGRGLGDAFAKVLI